MKLLVINCGSSSIKFSLFEERPGAEPARLAWGLVAELGQPTSALSLSTPAGEWRERLDRPDHPAGLAAIMAALVRPEAGVLASLAEVGAVGHRTVHAGDKFTGSVLIDEEVIAKLTACIPLAPLHNPANLAGIAAARELLPGAAQVGVFDTTFHQTMPPRAFLYALPYELYQRHGLRKYGFHGTSCAYVAGRAARWGGGPPPRRMVICHLGNGCTVAAVQDGQSVDTSLGFTPLEGVMMGTRCGDLDPGVVLYLQRELGMGLAEVDRMLNQEAGLRGVSGVTNDVRCISDLASNGHAQCALALDMFTYRVRKYLGAYAAVLGGLDLVVFTGGIGENSPLVRRRCLERLEFAGVALDPALNEAPATGERAISPAGAPVTVLVIPTDEELMIARETARLAAGWAGEAGLAAGAEAACRG
ncbi:MAG: acetate kinase [Deltaproteobacteria bacterium]|nr:acetate kinase [Deltaproteobacteria bacterium]